MSTSRAPSETPSLASAATSRPTPHINTPSSVHHPTHPTSSTHPFDKLSPITEGSPILEEGQIFPFPFKESSDDNNVQSTDGTGHTEKGKKRLRDSPLLPTAKNLFPPLPSTSDTGKPPPKKTKTSSTSTSTSTSTSYQANHHPSTQASATASSSVNPSSTFIPGIGDIDPTLKNFHPTPEAVRNLLNEHNAQTNSITSAPASLAAYHTTRGILDSGVDTGSSAGKNVNLSGEDGTNSLGLVGVGTANRGVAMSGAESRNRLDTDDPMMMESRVGVEGVARKGSMDMDMALGLGLGLWGVGDDGVRNDEIGNAVTTGLKTTAAISETISGTSTSTSTSIPNSSHPKQDGKKPTSTGNETGRELERKLGEVVGGSEMSAVKGVTKNSAGPTPTSNSSISISTSVPAFSTGKATASIKVDKPVQGSRQGGERVGFEVPNEHNEVSTTTIKATTSKTLSTSNAKNSSTSTHISALTNDHHLTDHDAGRTGETTHPADGVGLSVASLLDREQRSSNPSIAEESSSIPQIPLTAGQSPSSSGPIRTKSDKSISSRGSPYSSPSTERVEVKQKIDAEKKKDMIDNTAAGLNGGDVSSVAPRVPSSSAGGLFSGGGGDIRGSSSRKARDPMVARAVFQSTGTATSGTKPSPSSSKSVMPPAVNLLSQGAVIQSWSGGIRGSWAEAYAAAKDDAARRLENRDLSMPGLLAKDNSTPGHTSSHLGPGSAGASTSAQDARGSRNISVGGTEKVDKTSVGGSLVQKPLGQEQSSPKATVPITGQASMSPGPVRGFGSTPTPSAIASGIELGISQEQAVQREKANEEAARRAFMKATSHEKSVNALPPPVPHIGGNPVLATTGINTASGAISGTGQTTNGHHDEHPRTQARSSGGRKQKHKPSSQSSTTEAPTIVAGSVRIAMTEQGKSTAVTSGGAGPTKHNPNRTGKLQQDFSKKHTLTLALYKAAVQVGRNFAIEVLTPVECAAVLKAASPEDGSVEAEVSKLYKGRKWGVARDKYWADAPVTLVTLYGVALAEMETKQAAEISNERQGKAPTPQELESITVAIRSELAGLKSATATARACEAASPSINIEPSAANARSQATRSLPSKTKQPRPRRMPKPVPQILIDSSEDEDDDDDEEDEERPTPIPAILLLHRAACEVEWKAARGIDDREVQRSEDGLGLLLSAASIPVDIAQGLLDKEPRYLPNRSQFLSKQARDLATHTPGSRFATSTHRENAKSSGSALLSNGDWTF